MVDFQSRDTRRGVGGDGDDEADADDEDVAADEAVAADESGTGTESAGSEPTAETGYAVVAVAPEPSIDADPAGDAAVAAIEAAGAQVVTREAVRPAYDGVQSALDSLVDRRDVVAVVTLGGTGVEPHDVTVDAVEPLLDRRLPGFGELFRTREHDEVGTAVIGTRATAGIVDGVPVFCLPGVPEAARRGVRDIVVPEADRLADLAGADRD